MVATAAKASGSAADFINQLESVSPHLYSAIVISVVAAAASVLASMLLLPVFQAMMLRWWIGGLRFGTLSVHSKLRTATIYAAYLRLLWYGLLFALAIGIAAAIGLSAVGALVRHFPGPADAINAAGAFALYIVTMLGYSAIYQGTVKLALWRCGVESATLEGAAALEAVTAEGTPSSAVGEGLADALNVGGF
jgi:uncharacterized membrane protein YjgN (DUF898 family)